MSPQRQWLHAAIIACLLSGSTYTAADLLTWDGNGGAPADGVFRVAANWLSDVTPTVGDDIQFNLVDTYTVTLDQDEAVDEIRGLAGVVTFASDSTTLRTLTLATGSADMNVNGGSIQVGSSANPVFLNLPNINADGGLNTSVMNIGSSADGTVSVVGANSRFDVLGAASHSLGFGGNQGQLIVSDNGTANIGSAGSGGTLNVGDSINGGSQGTVTVNSGGTLNIGHMDIAPQTSAATGTVTVSGAGSSIHQTVPGANLVVGSASGGLGTLSVDTGGAFFAGDGTITLDATGTIDIQDGAFSADGQFTMNSGSMLLFDGGSLDANGGLNNSAGGTLDFRDGVLTVSGGLFVPAAVSQYEIDGPSGVETPHLRLDAGGTMNVDLLTIGSLNNGELTVANGALVSGSQGFIGGSSESTGVVTIDGVGSDWTLSTELAIGVSGNGTLNITNGGTVSSPGAVVDLDGLGDASGTITVTGMGSSWTNSGQLGFVGNGRLDILDGATVTSASAEISFGLIAFAATVDGVGSTWTNSGLLAVNNNGTLDIQNGGSMTSVAAIVGGIGSQATVTVDGAGSFWDSDLVEVGGYSGNTGTPLDSGIVNIQNSGIVLAETVRLFAPGTIRLDGGSLVTNVLDNSENGTFNFISGSLTIESGIDIGTGNLFPGSVTLDSDRHLVTTSTTSISPFRTLTIDGGSLQTGSLDIQGTLRFDRGTLGITGAAGLTIGAAGPFGSTLSIGSGQDLQVTNTLFVESGSNLSMSIGGIISAGAVSNSGSLSGGGTLAAPLTNNTDGEIQGLAGTNLVITGAGNMNNGQITLSGGHVHFTQDLTNGAMGLVMGNGTLRADGGLTNDGMIAFSATDNVIGVVSNNVGGVIISAGGTTTFFDDVTNNGEIRTSQNSFTVYFGSYSGLGDTGTGTVIMEGDLKPGSSPGTMAFAGSLSFGAGSSLDIELGGLAAGVEHDLVTVAAEASLGGMLNLSLIGGFVPATADTFTILQAIQLTGAFSNVAGGQRLDLLNDSGSFLVSYAADSVVLSGYQSDLSCDLDFDSNCDGTDIDLLVAEIASGAEGPSFDLTGDGLVDTDDLNEWLAVAGANNLASENAYLVGDANLDGIVNVLDFDLWNENKFTVNSRWTLGDFNADGAIDISDLHLWNANKFQNSLGGGAAIPEPTFVSWMLLALVGLLNEFLRVPARGASSPVGLGGRTPESSRGCRPYQSAFRIDPRCDRSR